ncbi:MAG: response regulator [Candidatus Omnitrophica bacterium]|nr:response regulator [Candidatus Omnitrophota bacterium]
MPKKKILLIDDEANFTHLLKLNLEASGGYEVREVNKGLEGLDAAREYKPDLIFLDIIMPDIAGGDLASMIRSDETIGHTPIIFLTAIVSRDETVDHGGFIGGYPCVAKPVNLEEIIDVIEKHGNGRKKAGG